MLSGKVYVVTSPDLVGAVNRNSKALAFNPFIAQLGKRITGHDEATSQIVQHNLNGEHGPGYVVDIHDGIVAALAPGKSLEKMTGVMLQEASNYLQALEKEDGIDLFMWTRQMVTMCSTRAIYGSKNPFNGNPKFENAFWSVSISSDTAINASHFSDVFCRDFDRDLNLLIADIAPSILAPKGNQARSTLAVAFQHYFENYVPEYTQSSGMIQTRSAVNSRYGILPLNQGRLEVGTLLGILANTIPSIFYMFIHIYSDPVLLQDIRHELETTSISTVPGETTQYLRILTMREKCHLLHATFQELLRVHALGAGSRFVREDVMLDNQYLLKKGMVVQMPMAVMHSDPLAWGADVNEFQPRRFLKRPDRLKEFKPNLTAYRPFGGGASLCPGRHFVTLEAMGLAACLVLRYDLTPMTGQWSIPRQKQESLATNVFPPEKDIKVKIERRKGFEDAIWDFIMD